MFAMNRNLIRKPGIILLMFILLTSGVVCFAGSKPTKETKEDSSPQDKVFGDWGVACETTPAKEKKCFISQVQTMKKDGKQLLKISVGYIGPKGEPTVVALLPLGISLPAGTAFKIDNNPQVKMMFQFCAMEGCVASAQLDKASVQEMMDGKSMLVGIVPSISDNKTVSINVSLKGFKDGFNSLSH